MRVLKTLQKLWIWIFQLRLTPWLLGISFSVISLYLALRGVDLEYVWGSLSGADNRFVTLALVSVAINTFVKGVRWKTLMGRAGKQIPLITSCNILLIGQLLNTVLPARVGDVGRAYLIGNHGLSRTFALSTVALEKIIDMVMYLLLFTLLLLLMPVPTWVSQPITPFAIIALSAFIAVLLVTYHRGILLSLAARMTLLLPVRLHERFTRLVESALTSLDVLQEWRSTFWIGLWSLVIWITAVLNNFLVLQALRIDAPPAASVFVLVVLQAGIALPSVPGRIGIFQYLCVLALGVFMIDQSQALSYGVLLHAIVFVPTSLLGAVLLWASNRSLHQMLTTRLQEQPGTSPQME